MSWVEHRELPTEPPVSLLLGWNSRRQESETWALVWIWVLLFPQFNFLRLCFSYFDIGKQGSDFTVLFLMTSVPDLQRCLYGVKLQLRHWMGPSEKRTVHGHIVDLSPENNLQDNQVSSSQNYGPLANISRLTAVRCKKLCKEYTYWEYVMRITGIQNEAT